MTTNSKLKDINCLEIQALLAFHPFYQIRQRNGERVYGPPIDGSLEKPTEGSEVYVYQIPNDCFEDELVPFFDIVGPIYQLRLKVNFSGEGRGYAYVQYVDPFVANRAVYHLKDLTLRAGLPLRIHLSFDNKQLRIERLSEQMFSKVVPLIREGVSAHLYDSRLGVLTLKYESHHCASMARRAFYQSSVKNGLNLEWVSPQEQKELVTSILIRNIPVYPNLKSLKKEFTFGQIIPMSVTLIEDLVNVRYPTRRDAELAFQILMEWSKSNRFEICWAFE